jgi:hypothetical protein
MLGVALDKLRGVVPYLRAEVGPLQDDQGLNAGFRGTPGGLESELLGADGSWYYCSSLMERPASLGNLIRATGLRLGTEDQMVAASLFVQGYSFRLLALVLGCMTTAAVVPDPEPQGLAIGLNRGRPNVVAFIRPRVLLLGGLAEELDASAVLADPALRAEAVAFVVDRAINLHLKPLVVAVRSTVRVGSRLLWGNISASSAAAVRTMEGYLGEWVRPIGEELIAAGPADFRVGGSYIELRSRGRSGWFWERTSCCLYDKLPSGIRCADCSLTPASERRAAYLATLETEPDEP